MVPAAGLLLVLLLVALVALVVVVVVPDQLASQLGRQEIRAPDLKSADPIQAHQFPPTGNRIAFRFAIPPCNLLIPREIHTRHGYVS